MRIATAVLLGCLGSYAFAGCGGEAEGGSDGGSAVQTPTDTDTEPRVVESSPPSAEPTAECADLLPDAVLEALGWPVAEPAGESAGRCERQSEHSTLIVGRLPTVARGEGQEERAQKAYDEGCAGLFRSGSATPDKETTWLGPDVTACYRGLPTGKDMGFAELYLLTADDDVVHVQASVTRATTQEQLQAGLALVADQAEAAY